MTLISELPRGLKELAELRRSECTSKAHYHDSDHLDLAFLWTGTKEDYYFWCRINEGNFTSFYNCKISKTVKKRYPLYASVCGTAMRLQKTDGANEVYYYRDAGAWGVWAKCVKGRLIVTGVHDHLVGEELTKITEQQYLDDNHGYV